MTLLNILLQRILPHHLLSRLMLRFMRIRIKWIKNLQTAFVIWKFNIALDELENPDPKGYEHFNAFFTRALKTGARPIDTPEDPDRYCSPVDGTVSQFGQIRDGQLMQAKGIDYSLLELIGGDEVDAGRFENGHFATIYLSPRDYHRIHMPATGRLSRMTYVPGRLFSVADSIVENLPNLFTRNERVVNIFETDNGPLAVILVGALFVGCMDTVWAGTVTPPHGHQVKVTDYPPGEAPVLAKGAEMGRFNMGSTVIVLWPQADRELHWADGISPGATTTMGCPLAGID